MSEASTKTIEVWITANALGTGVYKATGHLVTTHGLEWFSPDRIINGYHMFGPEHWHLTEEAARKRVRKMIASELRHLARKAKSLRALDEAAKLGMLPMAEIRKTRRK